MKGEDRMAIVAEKKDRNKGVYTAFGETKTLHQWSLDPRCEVPMTTLYYRIRVGDPLESAMILARFMRKSKRERQAAQYEAFGESKSISEWAEDLRCRVDAMKLRLRLSQGMDVEEALTTPFTKDVVVTAFSETKTLR